MTHACDGGTDLEAIGEISGSGAPSNIRNRSGTLNVRVSGSIAPRNVHGKLAIVGEDQAARPGDDRFDRD